MLQQEDVVLFAKLVMSLATNNPSAVQYVHKSMEIVARHYSTDLVQVIHTLMKPLAPAKVKSFLSAAGIMGRLTYATDHASTLRDFW